MNLTYQKNGASTLCSMHHFLPHIMRTMFTDRITPFPHLTSWKEKNNMKSKDLSIIANMTTPRSTLSNGKVTPMKTMNGSKKKISLGLPQNYYKNIDKPMTSLPQFPLDEVIAPIRRKPAPHSHSP